MRAWNCLEFVSYRGYSNTVTVTVCRQKLHKYKLSHILVWFGFYNICSTSLLFPKRESSHPKEFSTPYKWLNLKRLSKKISEESTCLSVSSKILVSIPCVLFRIWTLLPSLAALQDFISWSLIGAKINVLDKCQWYQFEIHLPNSLV